MRQGNNPRRGRGRSGRRPNSPPRVQTFDSNGPEGRIRGNATQVYEKYIALARDAQSAGDHVKAEALLQFAEHYFRVMNDSTDPNPNRPRDAQNERQHEGRDRNENASDDEDGQADGDGRADGDGQADGDEGEEDSSDNSHRGSRRGPGSGPVSLTEDDERAAPRRNRNPRQRNGAAEGESRGQESAPRDAQEPEDAGLMKILGEAPRGAGRGRRKAAEADSETAGSVEANSVASSEQESAGEEGSAPETEDKPRRRRTRKASEPASDGGEEPASA